METKIMQTGLAARQQDPAREQEMHGLATAPNFSANWFAAYTNSHHEKSVASLFAERQIESFLPLYATLHRWKNGCEMNLELPLRNGLAPFAIGTLGLVPPDPTIIRHLRNTPIAR